MTGSVLTLDECANELKVTTEDVLSLIYNQELKAKKIGNDYRIPICNFYQYLEQPQYIVSELHEIKTNLQILINQTSTIPVEKRLLSDVLNEVLQLKIPVFTSNTLEWNDDIAKHIHRNLGMRFVDELTPKDIQEFYNTISINNNGKKISDRLMLGIKGLLTLVLNYSFDNKYIKEIPLISSIRLPKTNTPDPHLRFMDYDEICALLRSVENSPTYTTMAKLLIMTGLRIGEALGLYWQDVDMENNIIHIRRALVREYYVENGEKKCKYVIGSTKTPESVRDIPVAPQVVRLLQNWKIFMHCQKRWMNAIHKNNTSHLVFPNKRGQLQNEHTFRTNFRGFVKRNNGDHLNVTFHRLRHSYGSFLLELGEQLITVSRLLGHKNIRVSADIYCTVTDRLKLQAADNTRNIRNNIS
ncbi:tyrosine-type recombinase/integrase [Oscillospiraceae bacterium PP1C4]